MPAGIYGENGRITIKQNGFIHLTGQEILAAAWHQLDKGVELLCQMGWSLADAWKQCSEEPARQFGIGISSIAVGEPADFVLSSYTKETGLRLEKILVNGMEHSVLPVNPVHH
jgi:N-acetylglucosamine-6-phosphate deacetylase